MTNASIIIENLTKIFNKQKALNDISASIKTGKITGLVGPDGAGKTTLMRHLAGLIVPDQGKVSVLGFDTIREAPAFQSSIGYMPQQFGLYEDLSIQENLNLYANLKGLPKQEWENTFCTLLQMTDLTAFRSRLAGRLSGGMKQKLGLACALLTKPRILLLDEPGVGVDPISRQELWAMVSNLSADGTTVVWSTAYLDEAALCDMVLCLSHGKIIYDGTPQKLTQTVNNKVFHLHCGSEKRKIFHKVQLFSSIVDCVLQGDAIRIVLQNEKDIETLRKQLPHFVKIGKTTPKFEDAILNLLGGISHQPSALAASIPQTPNVEKPIIEAIGLTKIFDQFTAASDISFKIHRGEIFGLLGPNGAGKSTTFKMLCGLLTPTKGQGLIAGLDLHHDGSKARNQLGYMAQKFSLYGDLNIIQNLNFFAGAYGMNRKQARIEVDRMVDIFDLGDFITPSAKNLPLGLKQRLALAASVMHHPLALFLDEPTSGVDPIARREFWNHINGLASKGVTILVTTHFMDEAEYCDRISLIYRGQSIAMGTPDDLKKSVSSLKHPIPTMEEAFIELIKQSDNQHMIDISS